MPTRSDPTFEYSVFVRFIHNGQPGPLNRRYFPNAGLASSFMARLDAPGSPAAILCTVARREVGTWEYVDARTLEAAAAEEGGRP